MITLYCSERFDGIAAAAIIMRHATLSKLPVTFGHYLRIGELHTQLEQLAQRSGQRLFILDIPFAPEHLPLLEAIRAKNVLLYWNSHHAQSIVPPAKLTDHAEKQCSAELAQKRFLPEDAIAQRIAQLAHEVEFWKDSEEASKLSDLIAAKYPPIELIADLSKGIFWSDKFAHAHHEYTRRKEEAYGELMKSLTMHKYVSYTFGFASATPLIHTADAGQYLLDKHSAIDVSVTIYRDGTVAFRKRDTVDADVAELAALFGGGGQPYAAAAKLPKTITKEIYPDVLKQLDTAFKNYFHTTFK